MMIVLGGLHVHPANTAGDEKPGCVRLRKVHELLQLLSGTMPLPINSELDGEAAFQAVFLPQSPTATLTYPTHVF